MALNQLIVTRFELDDIIDYRLTELVGKMHREGFVVEKSDIEYELFGRCESLWIEREKLYPDEDLPSKFGVYRGYSGGGVHGSLCQAQVNRMKRHRIAKAERLLEYFRQTCRGILKNADRATEENTGEILEIWEKTTF